MLNKIFAGLGGVIVVVGLLTISGCGKSDPAPATTTAYGACAAGQVQTQYGCQSQGGCQSGFALYNNQCIPATNGTTCSSGQFSTQYGCMPVGNCQYGVTASYNGQCVPVTNNNNGYNNNNGCQAGYVFTQIGCLPQGSCRPGTAYSAYYNDCVPASQPGYNNGYNNNGYNGGGGNGGGAYVSYCIGPGCY